MRLAVISDVHANLPALEAVLRDCRASMATDYVCLGDIVGYCVFPKETIALLEQAHIPCVQGNHDLMAAGLAEPDRCGPNARAAIHWTRKVIDDRERTFLSSCSASLLVEPGILALHSVLGSPWPYMRTPEQHAEQAAVIRTAHPFVSVCLTGHTHRGGIVEVGPGGRARMLPPRRLRLKDDAFYFLNPGSVGHPRGEDYRASYLLFDVAMRTVRFRKVPYDRRTMDRANREQGIHTNIGPSVLAARWSRARKTARSAVGALRRLVRRQNV